MFESFSKSAIEHRYPARQLWDDMREHFNRETNWPDPVQEPIRFGWFCKLYQHQMKQKGVDIVFPKSTTKLDVRV